MCIRDRDHATLFFGDIHAVLKASRGWLEDLVNRHYLHTFDYLYPGEAPLYWRDRNPRLHAPDLWIDARARKLCEIPPPGAKDGTDYTEATEDLLITDLRRAMDPHQGTVAGRDHLLSLAVKYWLS